MTSASLPIITEIESSPGLPFPPSVPSLVTITVCESNFVVVPPDAYNSHLIALTVVLDGVYTLLGSSVEDVYLAVPKFKPSVDSKITNLPLYTVCVVAAPTCFIPENVTLAGENTLFFPRFIERVDASTE